MSSRILRRLRQEDNSESISACELYDGKENLDSGCGGARRKNLPTNPFDLLTKQSQSESDEQEDVDITHHSHEDVRDEYKKRKKKKKRKRSGKKVQEESNLPQPEEELNELELFALFLKETQNQHQLLPTSFEIYPKTKEVFNIKLKNLNANNEIKRIFGSKVIGSENRRRNRSRVHIKSSWLVNPKENWPPLGKTGLSMRHERTNANCSFAFVHNADYQKIQRKFLQAVNSFNQENIAAIAYTSPYHVDALIQLSDLYKLTDDLQTAADLNERALYSLESAFHPLFNMATGNCELDYRRQENRALFICLFKHLTFVGQRACYQTALELCKLLLSFDFELDPLAIILCIDFYALRSRNYEWLIDVSKKWEKKKNLSQLPNFAFSTALAHFCLAEANNADDFTQADKLLQDALILFPGVLNVLLEKCSVHLGANVSSHHFFDSDVDLTQSRALTQLITLYVHRTYCEWKTPNVISWLERNVHAVIQRVDSGEKFVKDCLLIRLRNYYSAPRNVLRHIILSDIKEVTATISANISSPILSFDPLPPLDSVDTYSYAEFSKYNEETRTLTSLFFASLLPNFHENRRGENDLAVANHTAVEDLLDPVEAPNGENRDTGRDGVRMLLDAIGAIVAGIPFRNRSARNGDNGSSNQENRLPQNEDHREASEPN
ncbi:hypothetical protein R5R35_010760 [Gryllus longicercus]|uniref:Transcription factor 25 n=1 Tax=Gryllus longicercus TaxID=2509291 RepID=A0AAN9Z4T4_9ORTH